jgi:hypothetical protein
MAYLIARIPVPALAHIAAPSGLAQSTLLHAMINARGAAPKAIMTGLEDTEWQLPALLGLVAISIGAAWAIWRRQG